MEWETGLVFRDTRYLCLQNVTFWQAVKAELLLWLLLPWNNTAVCEETTIAFHNTLSCTCKLHPHPALSVVSKVWRRSEDKGEWGVDREREVLFCFFGWSPFVVIQSTCGRRGNELLIRKQGWGGERKREGGETHRPTDRPHWSIVCLHTDTQRLTCTYTYYALLSWSCN